MKGCPHRPWVTWIEAGGTKRYVCRSCVDKITAAAAKAGVQVFDERKN